MVGLGVLMLLLALWGRGHVTEVVFMSPAHYTVLP